MQMTLIKPSGNKEIANLLPKDGWVQYYSQIWDEDQCAVMFDALLQSLHWETDQLVMFGEVITTKRKVVWVGDEGRSYTYSGIKKYPHPWITELLAIKTRLEELAQWKDDKGELYLRNKLIKLREKLENHEEKTGLKLQLPF